jgi:hypothetical protein
MANAHLIIIGEMISTAAAGDLQLTCDHIEEMNSTPEGSEMLRLIVRDDLGGAADVIAAALWDSL